MRLPKQRLSVASSGGKRNFIAVLVAVGHKTFQHTGGSHFVQHKIEPINLFFFQILFLETLVLREDE